MRAASMLVVLLLLVGCAHARPKVRVAAPVVVVAPAPVAEKVSKSELLQYNAAFLTFKALEAAILEKHKIDAAAGEVFDPDTGTITRVKRSR